MIYSKIKSNKLFTMSDYNEYEYEYESPESSEDSSVEGAHEEHKVPDTGSCVSSKLII